MNRIVKILIPVTILLIPAYLVRFEIFDIPTNVLEILVLICFGLAVFKEQRSSASFGRDDCQKPSLYIGSGVALVLAGLLISTLANENYRTGFGIIKGWFIIPLVFGWVLTRETRVIGGIREVLKWLYLGVFLVAVISLVYYFMGDLTYDGRLKAFYLSPNHLAIYLAPAVFIGVYLINLQLTTNNLQRNKVKNFFIFLSLLAILAAFYLTYSYSAWAAVLLSLVTTSLIVNRKINKQTVLVGLIILLLVVVSQWNAEKFENLKNFSRSSLESRMTIWQSAIKMLRDNWLTGIGPGNFQNKYLQYQRYFPPYLEWAVPQPHNLYLAFWLESGILGLAGFFILVTVWIKKMLGLAKKKQEFSSWIILPLLSIMFYILLHGLIDTPYWKNDLALIFWAIFSLGIILQKSKLNAV